MGAGTSPAGMFPAGMFAPTTSSAMSATGTYGAHSSLNIDPTTRDYTFDAYGNEEGMTDEGQRVMFLLRTLANSRRDFPEGFDVPEKAGSNVGPEVEQRVREALEPVIQDHTIELVSVASKSDSSIPTTVYAEIIWRNTRTSRIETSTLPLRL